MRVLDVSSHQGMTGTTMAMMREADAVIVKVSEGTSYVNPFLVQQAEYALSQGKRLGLYHYSRGGSTSAEADYFTSAARSLIPRAIPFIDWESAGNSSWGSTTWARSFSDRCSVLCGKRSHPYVQASAIWQVASMASDHMLWVAGYPDMRQSWDPPAFPYGTSPWKSYGLWQYTSGGGYDRSVSTISPQQWDQMASGTGNTNTNDSGGEDMFGCIIWMDDAHGGYPKGMGCYWSPATGVIPLPSADDIAAINVVSKYYTGKNLPEVHSSSRAPWVVRYQEISAQSGHSPALAAESRITAAVGRQSTPTLAQDAIDSAVSAAIKKIKAVITLQ